MSDLQFIQIILTSTVISSLIAGFINWIVPNINYRNKYYEMILTRRLQAHENIEKVFHPFKLYVQENDYYVHRPFYNGVTHFIQIFIEFADIKASGFWLSDELVGLVDDFYYILYDMNVAAHNSENPDIALKTIGLQRRDEIQSLRGKLRIRYVKT